MNGVFSQTSDRSSASKDNPYYDDNNLNDKKEYTCQWCNALASLSIFCPTPSPPSSSMNKMQHSKSKEKNHLGTPLPDTPVEARRKRRLLEGLLEAEESTHDLLAQQHIEEVQ
jgi:hypothetical protein